MQEKNGISEGKLDHYEEKRKMEDRMSCQEVIQILTRKNLTVKAVKAQYSIRNVENRSVILDILAEDDAGRIVNLEMQPQEDEDHARRVRYHLSSIDMSLLEKGAQFDQISEVYLIYITEKDFIGAGKAISEVDRTIRGTKQILDNGVHELYVNFEGIAEKKYPLKHVPTCWKNVWIL